jgi:20S proteasome subunit beta 4
MPFIMDTLFGFVGKDYVIIAADRAAQFSILKFHDTEDKIAELDGNKLLAAGGDTADRINFSDLLQKNIHLYYYRNSIKLSTLATANFVRTLISENLRKKPAFADLLIAGIDEEPSIFYLDYLGVLQKVRKAAHGHAGNFLYGLMDNWWKPVRNM